MLGLEVCADTVVGNQMLRGISGGQKKRVTSGEALVGHAKVRPASLLLHCCCTAAALLLHCTAVLLPCPLLCTPPQRPSFLLLPLAAAATEQANCRLLPRSPQQVLYADEISTGLDSNTTHQITKSLRNYCHVMNVSPECWLGLGELSWERDGQ